MSLEAVMVISVSVGLIGIVVGLFIGTGTRP